MSPAPCPDRKRIECESKIRYESRPAALKALRGVARRRGKHAIRRDRFAAKFRLGPYQCPHCHAWHLGNLATDRRGQYAAARPAPTRPRPADGSSPTPGQPGAAGLRATG